jgi:RNA polymerase sigma-70 factor (ECF subfamily)
MEGRLEEYTDAQLLAGVANGDAAAGRAFFLRYRQKAFKVAYRLLGNEADAMDAVEDAFVKVITAAPGFRGEASVKTWFYRILVNTSLDARRRRRATVSLDAAADGEEHRAEIAVSRDEDPGDAAERGETAEKIRKAIADLDEKHRTVFVLAAVEGLSYKEIADALGIAVGTVMSRLFYARKYLQKSLKGYLGAGNG